MESSVVSRLQSVLLLALVASSMSVVFRMPDLTWSPQPIKPNASHDFYEKPPEIICDPANMSCLTTGPSCVRSCAGLSYGNYQSCTSCNKFVTCAPTGMVEMSCPLTTVWDDKEKMCRHTSLTCIPCPVNSVSWFKDRHGKCTTSNNYITDDIRSYAHSAPDLYCTSEAVVKLQAPHGAKAIQFYLSFYESPYRYAFHISNDKESDGWGRWDGSSQGGNDAEIHSYNGDLYAFENSNIGSYDIINKEKFISSHLYIKITPTSIYVNNFRGDEVTINKRVFRLDQLYFGLNRVVSNSPGGPSPDYRYGSGLDAVWISWIL